MTRHLVNSRVAGRLILGLVFLALSHGPPALGDDPASDATSSDADDVQDLIFYSARSPVLIRLRIQIDGWGIQQLRQEHARQLLTMLDGDKDGRLSETEAAGIPSPAALAPLGSTTPVAVLATSVDADADGAVTIQELSAYLGVAAGASLTVVENVQQTQNAAVELFDRLDRDQDGVLTPTELELAETRLRKMDVNDDEFVHSNEIQPRIQVFGQPPVISNSERATAALALLVEVPPHGAEDRTARDLLRHYDKLGRDPRTRRFVRDRQLSAEELGRPTAFIAPYDANGDGRLSTQELAELIRNPSPDFELQIDGSRDGESNFTVVKRPANNPWGDEFDLQQEWPGRVQLRLAGLTFACASNFVQSKTNYEQAYREQFDNADADQNDYLSPAEFNRLGANSELFARVDADGDQMVVVEELASYVRVQSLLERSRVAMTAANNSKSLFDHVDLSADQMLDDRELAGLAERIREWDRDGDGALATAEFEESFRVVFTAGNRDPLRGGDQLDIVARSRSSLRPARRQGVREGDERWFSGMDRNRDGRISRREFLGTRETFTSLDRDQDGYIARGEANAAE